MIAIIGWTKNRKVPGPPTIWIAAAHMRGHSGPNRPLRLFPLGAVAARRPSVIPGLVGLADGPLLVALPLIDPRKLTVLCVLLTAGSPARAVSLAGGRQRAQELAHHVSTAFSLKVHRQLASTRQGIANRFGEDAAARFDRSRATLAPWNPRTLAGFIHERAKEDPKKVPIFLGLYAAAKVAHWAAVPLVPLHLVPTFLVATDLPVDLALLFAVEHFGSGRTVGETARSLASGYRRFVGERRLNLDKLASQESALPAAP
jgi:hypothetical protein